MILLIDTSQETGTVAIARKGEVLFSEENKIPKEHARWLHTAVNKLVSEAKINLRDLEAVAVVAGPGSYTGLRVGMAAAKGFCYALKIPLITLNTLLLMAESIIETALEKQALICPMIDARREEVFTALYKVDGHRSSVNQILPPQSLILDKNSFETELSGNPIIFFGTGAAKWEKICSSPLAVFLPQPDIKQAFATLAQRDFEAGNWSDPVYAEPVYLKEFFTY
jgi:tRNA threonylcarbamoyladenosine biosynthesis protein TsaB